ncbi:MULTISPECIES: hypothetical protein [Bacteria]|uniref:hypothetical protein n=1 Tax=Bacteria TaxID=2 RepID=UPI003C7D519A
MNATLIGAGVGALLALTWVAFGFWAFLFVGLAMLAGAGAARILGGRIDVRALADALRGRRSSS